MCPQKKGASKFRPSNLPSTIKEVNGEAIKIKYEIQNGKLPKDKSIIVDVFAATNYDVKKSSEIFGVAPRTFYDWITREDVAPIITQEREIEFSLAERNLFKMLEEGDPAATFFVLKTRKGYSEKSEVVHTGKIEHEHIQITYVVPEPPKDIDDIPDAEISE